MQFLYSFIPDSFTNDNLMASLDIKRLCKKNGPFKWDLLRLIYVQLAIHCFVLAF